MIKLEDLKVYVLAEQIGDDVWNKCLTWERFSKDTIGKQLVRAADSVAANIAEGYGRYAYSENLHFCYYARGSLVETQHWLRRVKIRKLLNGQELEELESLLQQLAPKLNAYINSIKTQRQKERTTKTNDK